MNTDSYCEIGSSHTDLEDYTITGSLTEDSAFVILSDGCSGSPNTDIGSKILVLIAREFLNSQIMPELQADRSLKDILNEDRYSNTMFADYIIKEASLIGERLGVDHRFLDATLLVAVAEKNSVLIWGFGDGCYAIKQGGNVTLRRIQYASEAPFYLSYKLSRKEEYIDTFGESIVKDETRTINLDYPSDKPWGTIDTIKFGDLYKNSKENGNEVGFFDWTETKWDFVTLMSDGVGSFLEKKDGQVEVVNWVEMVKQFTAYKNFKGEFVRRRMNKIKKESEKSGRVHYDDISVATIYNET